MSPDPRSQRLAERIYGAFPVTEPAFRELLGLLDIEATDEVSTAAVTTGARSRLQLNPGFVAGNCASDTDLVMLVLHELYHVVLGHTRLFARITPAQNWAFDAVINAQLCQLFPQAHQTALFRRLYPADRFPLAMLRPPEGWRTQQEHWALTGEAGAVHRALYKDTSVSYKQLYDLLPRLIGEGEGVAVGDLLGDHAGDDSLPPDVADEVRTIIARWPLVERRSGRDQGGSRDDEEVELQRARREAVAVIRKAIVTLADRRNDGGVALPRVDWAPVTSVLPYRTGPDRRADLRDAAGETALFHRTALQHHDRVRGERVHVYVDVSGSMSDALPGVYASLVPLLDFVDPAIHLFSTDLVEVSHADLRRRRAVTTGGTEIDAVTAHVLARDIGRAVILTDGWVGRIPGEHVAQIRKRGVRLGAVVTAHGNPGFVAPVGGKWWRLPKLAA